MFVCLFVCQFVSLFVTDKLGSLTVYPTWHYESAWSRECFDV